MPKLLEIKRNKILFIINNMPKIFIFLVQVLSFKEKVYGTTNNISKIKQHV